MHRFIFGSLLCVLLCSAGLVASVPRAYEQGLGFQGKGQWDNARRSFEKSILASPSFARAYEHWAKATATLSADAKAKNFIRGLKSRFPKTPYAALAEGLWLKERGRTQEALRSLKQALASMPQNADLFRILVEAWDKAGSLPSKGQSFLKNLAARRPESLAVLYGWAECLYRIKDFQKAGAVLSRAKKLSGASDSLPLLHLESLLLSREGSVEKAAGIERKLLGLAKASGDKEAEEKFAGNLAVSSYRLGKMELAVRYGKEALALAVALGDYGETAKDASNLGGFYEALGFYEEAGEVAEQAEQAAKQAGDLRMQAKSSLLKGIVAFDRGRYSEALAAYRSALLLARAVHDDFLEMYVWNLSANAYASLGDAPRALKGYSRAIRLAEQLKNVGMLASAYNNLALYWSELGRKDKAIAVYRKAYSSAKHASDRREEGIVSLNMGIAYQKGGKNKEALLHFKRARKIAENANFADALASTALNVGRMHYEGGRYALAENYLNEALTRARALGHPELEWTSESYLGDLRAAQGNFTEAVRLERQALSLLENTRAGLRRSAQKTGFLGKHLDVYERLVSLYLEHPKAWENAEQEAFSTAERMKARSFLEALASAREVSGPPSALLAKKMFLQSRIDWLEGRQAESP